MGYKQRVRKAKRARKAAAEAAQSPIEPRLQGLKENQNPEGHASNADQAKQESQEDTGEQRTSIFQQHVAKQPAGDHDSPPVDSDTDVDFIFREHASVFSLTRKLSEDPDAARVAIPNLGPKKSFWQRVSWIAWGTLIVTFVVGAPSAYVAIRDVLRYKGLRVQFYEKTPLVTPEFVGTNEFKLTHRGRPVSDPYRVLLTIRNTGTISLKNDDIKRPITFDFPKRILDASIIAKSPRDVDATCLHTDNSIIVNLGLFHAKEEFTIRVFCDGDPGLPWPTCRIDGIPQIECVDSITQPAPATTDKRWAPVK